MSDDPRVIVVSGLPGVGKSTTARLSWDWIDDEIRNHTPRAGLWLDTTTLSPDETTDAILERMSETIVPH